jgi:hypothetical protein
MTADNEDTLELTGAAQQRLMQIHARNVGGALEVDAIIEDARQLDSPLHGMFNWDISAAAQAHWRHRARQIIRRFTVVFVHEDRRIEVPAFVRDPAQRSGRQGYITFQQARSDADVAREVVVHEFILARSALQRARDVAAALSMEGEIEGLLAETARLQGKVQPIA